jgi:hypothetical protein
MFEGLKEKFSAHRASVAEANRAAHQAQEHLTDEQMARPDAMSTFASTVAQEENATAQAAVTEARNAGVSGAAIAKAIQGLNKM